MARQIIMTGSHAAKFVRQLMPQIEARVDERTLERLKAALPAEPEPAVTRVLWNAPDASYEDEPATVFSEPPAPKEPERKSSKSKVDARKTSEARKRQRREDLQRLGWAMVLQSLGPSPEAAIRSLDQ